MAAQQLQTTVTDPASLQRSVFVRILEEPASKALRFRYECEGRSAGSLPGANSTTEKKSFPKIQVVGHRGRAVVVVSCVTIDPPYRPHPHNLVGKEGCKKGVCTMEIANEDMTCEFSNLGIQCVKKKDIEDSLKIREEIRVDPFRTGFQHKSQPGSIDLNSVRLCFQVFLEGPERGQFKVPLKPVVSEPIYDKKAINDLTIMKLSDCTSPVLGNKEIILLCDKVSKDDIEIRFYEENEETGAVVWESLGDFQPSDVHKQYAICFRTPQYHNLEITSPARVYIQLRCPSKDTTSAPRPFQYIPLLTSGTACKRKWNLVSFSGAYSSYLTAATDNNMITDEPARKHKPPVDLEDILAHEDEECAESKVEPIYDQLNQFMNNSGTGDREKKEGQHDLENVYDLDLELISQIIKGQEEQHDMLFDVDLVDGNGNDDHLGTNTTGTIVNLNDVVLNDVSMTQKIILPPSSTTAAASVVPMDITTEQNNSTPPVRPPKSKSQSASTTAPLQQQQQPAPALPPKKNTTTSPQKSPTKQSPAAFLKNLFSPTKKKQQKEKEKANANANVNTQQVEQQQLSSSTTTLVNNVVTDNSVIETNLVSSSGGGGTGAYELTENIALYVDNEAPLATASEFGDDPDQNNTIGYYCAVNNNNQNQNLN